MLCMQDACSLILTRVAVGVSRPQIVKLNRIGNGLEILGAAQIYKLLLTLLTWSGSEFPT